MHWSRIKNLGSSKLYKYVKLYLSEGKEMVYCAEIPKYGWFKKCSSEREAAIAVDVKFIEKARNPVNILKPLKI